MLSRIRLWIPFAIVAGLIPVYAVVTSKSSTAVLGLLWVPVYAGLGALAGHVVSQLAAIAAKKAKLTDAKSVGLFIAVVIVGLYGQRRWSAYQLEERAANPQTPVTELQELLQKERLAYYVASNPALSEDLMLELVQRYPQSYSILGHIAPREQLGEKVLGRLLALPTPSARPERSIFQTYVWAPLVRAGRVPAAKVLALWREGVDSDFLLMALLESEHFPCDEGRELVNHSLPTIQHLARQREGRCASKEN